MSGDSSTKTIALLACLLLVGCGAPVPSSKGDLKNASAGLRYFKDKHGLCYAAINSISYFGYEVTSITAVPCEKVGL